MKLIVTILLCCGLSTVNAQRDTARTLKSILLEQLKTTHNLKDWFVPANIAVAGLTAEQANWKDNSDNHSIAMLTTHLIFWNKNLLDKFRDTATKVFNGDNKETFTAVTEQTWATTVQQLDQVLTGWEQAVAKADDAKLRKWYSSIAHVGTHNAYHIGQILYIRKMKGWWKDENGVK